ncbi:PREDICTED: uncharacterized protein LOC105115021 [Populus euphratica]|uniref:Uncharacterized protein LOC105115021 n=1 Tax=Populus euphratica TaxID=75702 RepID=A0AAJ6TFX8_POPEU|nr:PREDICTED: uncharacterized protein LOC105115021 [Populus euphratica]
MAETCKCALFILALITCFQILFTEGRPIKLTNKQELVSIGKDSIEDVVKQGLNTKSHYNNAKNQKVSLPAPPVTHNPSVHHSKAGRKEIPHPAVLRFGNSAAVYKDDSTPGVNPGIGHPKTIGTNSNSEHSLTDFKDDFQPTTPGRSPGAGHALANDDDDDNEEVSPKAPGSGIERSGTAFKPTTPGHSPGIGHLFSENDSEGTDPKAPDTSSSSGDSVTASKPKTTGNSRGIGHKLSADKSEITASKAVSIEHSVTGVADDFRPTVPGHSPGIGHVLRNTNEERKA